jgi:hypothetical protein
MMFHVLFLNGVSRFVSVEVSMSASDKGLLKRAVDAAEEAVEIAKRTRVAQEELSEKVDVMFEIVEQGAVRTQECVALLEGLDGRMRSLKSVAAAAGDGTASRGAGSGGGRTFEDFLNSAVSSQSMKGAIVKRVMGDGDAGGFFTSSDKTRLVIAIHQEFVKKGGVDKSELNPVDAAAAASWVSIGSFATAIATLRGVVKREGTPLCVFLLCTPDAYHAPFS